MDGKQTAAAAHEETVQEEVASMRQTSEIQRAARNGI
jgi:hypothetical protein